METQIQDSDSKVKFIPLVHSSSNPSCTDIPKFCHTFKVKRGEGGLIKGKESISPQSITPWLASSKQALNQCIPFSPLDS